MSDKYDIRHNSQEPSSESIRKRKDFEALLREYDRTAAAPTVAKIRRIRYSQRFAAAATVAMVLAVTALVWQKLQEAPPTDLASYRPLPQVPQPAVRFAVNNAKGDTLFQASGSRIIIPPSAFVHADGKPVNGDVQLDFKEYQDKTEMFLCGLPLENAEGAPFESAGMMEIQGFQNGKPVFIDKDKQLDVEILAQIPDQTPTNDVNLYSFSTSQNTWVYSGPDKLSVLSDASDGAAPANGNLQQAVPGHALGLRDNFEKQFPAPIAPAEPKRLNPNRFNFTLDVLPEQFPELAAQKDLIWEVSPESVFKEKWYDVDWTDIQLQHLPGENRYEASLKSGDSLTVRAIVYPVVKERDYRLALETYQKQLAIYKTALAQREASIQKAMASASPQNQPSVKDTLMAMERRPMKLILNHFAINAFGAWACLRVTQQPQGGKALENLMDDSGKALDYDWLYVTNDQQNTLFRYAKGARVNIDTNTNPTIWAVTTDKRLIACRLDENGVPRPSPGAMVSNEEEVRRVLGI